MTNVNVTVASEIELSPEVHAAKDKIGEAIAFAFNTVSDAPDGGELFDIVLLMAAAFFTASSPLKDDDMDVLAKRFRHALAHQNGSTILAKEKH